MRKRKHWLYAMTFLGGCLPRLEAAAHASPLAFKAGHENGNYREVEAFWQASSFPTSSMTIRQRRKKLLFPARRLQIPHFLR